MKRYLLILLIINPYSICLSQIKKEFYTKTILSIEDDKEGNKLFYDFKSFKSKVKTLKINSANANSSYDSLILHFNLDGFLKRKICYNKNGKSVIKNYTYSDKRNQSFINGEFNIMIDTFSYEVDYCEFQVNENNQISEIGLDAISLTFNYDTNNRCIKIEEYCSTVGDGIPYDIIIYNNEGNISKIRSHHTEGFTNIPEDTWLMFYNEDNLLIKEINKDKTKLISYEYVYY